MPAPFPRMHGLTHVSGGPDPVPFTSGGPASYPDIVQAHPCLVHYWPADETSGDLIDRKGTWNLTPTTAVVTSPVAGTFPQYGAPGPLTELPALTAVVNAGQYGVPADDHGRFSYSVGSTPPFWATSHPWTVETWLYLTSDVLTGASMIFATAGINIGVLTNKLYAAVSGGSAMDTVDLPLNQWHHIAVRYTGTSLEIVRNGSQVAAATVAATGGGGTLTFLNLATTGGTAWNPVNGRAAQLAIYDCALTDSEIGQRILAQDATGNAADGDVLTADGNGGVEWAAPTVEVEHGDVALDDTPVAADASPYAGGPTSSSGWHLAAHLETVVLYDANPARFVVPTRTWTRVPFDTIGIYRQWEPTVGSAFTTSKWLPDDRGLTDTAKQGLLHINSDMTFDTPMTVRAWYSIEWPVLDADELPNEPATSIDAYVRAGRILDVSHGFVLRASPGSSNRRFFEWKMLFGADDFDAGETWEADHASDSPYPIYPVWSPRPLTLPDPYPNVGEASGIWYTPRKTFSMDANLTAGDNLCLQAWQDSPWTLRFSTDTFEAGLATVPAFTHRPYLSVGFSYDPETIDHTTGKLL